MRTRPRHASASNPRPDSQEPSVSCHSRKREVEKYPFWCPVCEHLADVTWKQGQYGIWQWFIGSFSARCPHGGECLRGLAEQLGCTAPELKQDPMDLLAPLRVLRDPIGGMRSDHRATGGPAPLPTAAHLDAWRQNLLDHDEALSYLRVERGLTDRSIERYELGITRDSPSAFVFPVRDETGEIVNLKKRFWPRSWIRDGKQRKFCTLRGRDACLYPLRALIRKPAAFVICEGECDALLLNQMGLPAITSTAGTTWLSEWNRHIAGRRVVVLYDADASEKARRRAAGFCRDGAAEAWNVDLTRLGFTGTTDVTDLVVLHGMEPRKAGPPHSVQPRSRTGEGSCSMTATTRRATRTPRERLTDVGNSRRFTEDHKNRLIYVPGPGGTPGTADGGKRTTSSRPIRRRRRPHIVFAGRRNGSKIRRLLRRCSGGR